MIPIPSDDVQQKVLVVFDHAFAEKMHKDSEASLKIRSIDLAVLDALGIALPEQAENTLASRMFFTKSANLTGGRFDAPSNSTKFSLTSKRYQMLKLKDAYEINPRTNFRQFEPNDLLSFVPMEAISDTLGEIVECDARPINDSKGYTRFRDDDVLWAKITPCMQNGKSAVVNGLLKGFGFGSTEFHVFRPLMADANSIYLHAILRLRSLRSAAMNYFGGSAGHQRVDVDFFKRLMIPFPPAEVQNEIVEKVNRIYAEAKQLREEGAAILESAKAEVERMILGD